MQRIACYTAVAVTSMLCLVGCSSGWTFANWRDSLTFRKAEPSSTQSLAEMQERASQLEKLKQYDLAADVYGEILKRDHDNQLAQQRLTEIQRLKHGMLPEGLNRDSLPVSRETELRQTQRQLLPKIKPGPPEKSRSIAAGEQPAGKTNIARTSPETTLGQATLSTPPWVRSADVQQSSKPVSVEDGKKRIPLDQFVARSDVKQTSFKQPESKPSLPKITPAGSSQLPVIRDARSIREARNIPQEQTGIAQVSMAAVLPEIVQPATATQTNNTSLLEVQQRLSTHPADPSAIESLVQGLRTEDRTGRWEISSTLGVLVENPDAKSLIVDSLSRALSDQEPAMRRNTALVIASLGSHGQDLLPALDQRLKDQDQSVRTAAAYAIDQIR